LRKPSPSVAISGTYAGGPCRDGRKVLLIDGGVA
jgi:hypothetical protein